MANNSTIINKMKKNNSPLESLNTKEPLSM